MNDWAEMWADDGENRLEGSVMMQPEAPERDEGVAEPTDMPEWLMAALSGPIGVGGKALASGRLPGLTIKEIGGTIGGRALGQTSEAAASAAKRVVEPISSVTLDLAGKSLPAAAQRELFESMIYQDLTKNAGKLKNDALSLLDYVEPIASPVQKTKAEALRRYMEMSTKEIDRDFWGK